MANETSEDIMNLLNTKQIHELESLDRVSGKENILIDNGKVTYKITTDALLGYFINRFVGNVDEDTMADIRGMLSINLLYLFIAAESCGIHPKSILSDFSQTIQYIDNNHAVDNNNNANDSATGDSLQIDNISESLAQVRASTNAMLKSIERATENGN